jgi:LDH2 family malate/lactate/ureidoglycolate dehydrogenase
MAGRLQVPEEIAIRVEAGAIHRTVEGIFRALEMPEPDAKRCADVLIYADLRGIDSHGVSNMTPIYVGGLKQGWINPAPTMRTIREAPGVATVDSDYGLGLTIGPQAMRLAMEKAQACGIGSVVVTNGRHFGAAAYHAHLALEHDMIGVAMTVGGLHVVPTFGSQPKVGLNPIAVAAPTRHEPPFLFDASMSSVASNKISIAKRLGVHVGPGWLARPDGTPIMEEGMVPDEYLMLPLGATRDIGSHKGYGLAVLVDILSGLLGGDPAGFLRRPWDVSHHFVAYRIDAFTEVDAFRDRMDAFMKGLRETPPAPGHDRVLYAGLPEHETEVDRLKHGIPYHPDVVEWFRKTAAEFGVPHELGSGGPT